MKLKVAGSSFTEKTRKGQVSMGLAGRNRLKRRAGAGGCLAQLPQIIRLTTWMRYYSASINCRIDFTAAFPYDRNWLLNPFTEKSLPCLARISSRRAVISVYPLK